MPWVALIKAIPAVIALFRDGLSALENAKLAKIERELNEKNQKLEEITKHLEHERKKVEINEAEIKRLHRLLHPSK